jgi:hypothetical protein
MASARLRKAFRYPNDSDDADVREELDEEGLQGSNLNISPVSDIYTRARACNQTFAAAK